MQEPAQQVRDAPIIDRKTTYCSSGEKGVVQTRSLEKSDPEKYTDQAWYQDKSYTQGDSNDDVCAMICIGDHSKGRIVTIWDVEFGALRHLAQPIAGPPEQGR
jgi:hypothetical protein